MRYFEHVVICTYCTVGDAEKSKEHVVVSLGHQFADHGLCILCFICQGPRNASKKRLYQMAYRVVRRLE